MFQSCRQAKRQCRGNLSFSSCCLFSLTRLDDRGEREREREREYSDSEIVCWCAVYNCVSLLFDTFTTVLVEQFSKFLSFWGGWGRRKQISSRTTKRPSAYHRWNAHHNLKSTLLGFWKVCALYNVRTRIAQAGRSVLQYVW